MRKLLALTACCLALGSAHAANESPSRIAGVQPSSPAREDAMGIGDPKAKPGKPARSDNPLLETDI